MKPSHLAVFIVVVAMFATESVSASDEWLRANVTQKRHPVSAANTPGRYRSVHQKHARRPAETAAAIFQPASMSATKTVAAAAVEKPVSLNPAAGLDKVEANCGACHSLDYVQMNSRFLNAAGWEAEVAKMVNAFGAPITPADAKSIVDYLTANYGMPADRPTQ